jgi:sugar phosphate permease
MFLVNMGVHATAQFTFGLFIIPMAADLGVSRGLLGLAQSSRMIAAGASGFIVGRVVDRYGARVPLAVASVVAGLSLVGMGFINHIAWLFLLFVILGLSGLGGPGMLLTAVPVAKWFSKKRGLAVGLSTSGLAIGGLIFALLHGWLIDSFGWRTAWVVSGISMIVLVVPVGLLLVRREPEDMGLLPDGVQPEKSPAVLSTAQAKRPATQLEVYWTATEAMRSATLWKLVAVFMLTGFGTGGFMLHRVPFWEDRGIDRAVITYALSLDAIVFGVVVVGAGILLDRFPARVVVCTAFIIAIFTITLTQLWDGEVSLYTTFFLNGVAAGTILLSQVFIWAHFFGRGSLGAIRGITLPMLLLSTGLGAPLIGWIFDVTGEYTLAWWGLVVLYGLGFLVMLTVTKPVHPSRRTEGMAVVGGGSR